MDRKDEVRAAFEAWYVSEAKKQGLEITVFEMAMMRTNDCYGANRKYLNGCWDGYRAGLSAQQPATGDRQKVGAADTPRADLLDKTLREYTLDVMKKTCSAWSAAVSYKTGEIDQAACDLAAAHEKRLKSAINELADLSKPVTVTGDRVEVIAALEQMASLEGFDAFHISSEWANAFRSAISMLRAGAPEGWQLVPKELTEAMIREGVSHYKMTYGDSEEAMQSAYRAMLQAAPTPGKEKG